MKMSRVNCSSLSLLVRQLQISCQLSAPHEETPRWKTGWRNGGVEGGGVERWRSGGVEEWRSGGVERWRGKENTRIFRPSLSASSLDTHSSA